MPDRYLLSGDEAVALAAFDCGIALGSGYPGTPSTEILEAFSKLGGRAQWAPNEKVALEVTIGAAYGGARALATMKHVGLNVAADPLFTAAYTGVKGALVIVSADDPGMGSSQNEQDNRWYALSAGIPMLEPCDSQEAYDLFIEAVKISERWSIPVLFRMTTRTCHSKSIVERNIPNLPAQEPHFERDIQKLVMIPSNARPAHRRLQKKLEEIAAWNNTSPLNFRVMNQPDAGIITSGVSYAHVREAAPEASVLKLGVTHPLPMDAIRAFASEVKHCWIIEEGDSYLAQSIRAEGIPVEDKPQMYRFGELDVARVRRILAGDTTPEPPPLRGKAPQFCAGCPHARVFEVLRDMEMIVPGDIGCYALGALPPYSAMDTCLCMGASIGLGLGLRHVLPEEQARRVVSVIGDSTFIHSGMTGLAEMVYNPPETGHVVIILDNGTTAMTGAQEHPATGRSLDGKSAYQISMEEVGKAMGIRNVHVIGKRSTAEDLQQLLKESMSTNELYLIIARNPCLVSAKKHHDAAAAAHPAGEEQTEG